LLYTTAPVPDTATMKTLFQQAMAAIVMASAAQAAPLPSEPFRDGGVTVVPVDTKKSTLALFLKDADGRPFRSFERLAAGLSHARRRLSFAMNAGMYEENGGPVGLLVMDRTTDGGPRIVAASDYDSIQRGMRFATPPGS
jgi:uncharacterized protein YigE (DUF2233 family)